MTGKSSEHASIIKIYILLNTILKMKFFVNLKSKPPKLLRIKKITNCIILCKTVTMCEVLISRSFFSLYFYHKKLYL